MLDFPSSPAVNDRYQGFVWDGSVWGKPRLTPPASDGLTYVRKNGVWVPGVRHEFVNLQNVNTIDITVPDEARIMRWTGNPRLATTGLTQAYIVMRLSADGTTFGAAASSYGTDGYYTIGGTGAFTRWTPTSDTFAYIASAPTADSTGANEGHVIHGILNVERAAVGTSWAWKCYGWTFQTGANAWIKYDIRGWTSNQFDPYLRIKKVRMYTSTAQMWENTQGNGFQVEWIA